MQTLTDARQAVQRYRKPSNARGLVLFSTVALCYLLCLTSFCTNTTWLRWIPLLIGSFLIGQLFIIGHDACHLSLVRNATLNRLIGNLAFAPTLHPFSAWEIGHNRRHHGFTNLRYVDYVWCPWSVDEYKAAPTHARLMYRLFHTPFGIGLYYPIEIWSKHMWRTDQLDRSHRDFSRIKADRVRVALAFSAIASFCLSISYWRDASLTSALSTSLLAVSIPLIVYHYLMSVVIFIHHRHQSVVWYDSHDRYDPFIAQLRGTVHAALPRFAEIALLDIFQHTAHHVDERIPLYELADSQTSLESTFPLSVLTQSLSISTFLDTLRTCQLYDYKRQSWSAIRDIPVDQIA